jgi:hypothetical protein
MEFTPTLRPVSVYLADCRVRKCCKYSLGRRPVSSKFDDALALGLFEPLWGKLNEPGSKFLSPIQAFGDGNPNHPLNPISQG